jgi:uncharacterized membrane-anchored protein YhcB (DUF1043 family)
MPTNQLFFLALAFVVGILIGALVSWLFSGREKEAPPPHPELEKLLKLRAQYQERVSLWVERSSGKLMVRMGEQMAADPQQLSEPQRKQLQTLMREWLTWMGFPGSSPAAPAAPAAPARPAPSRQAVLVTPAPAAMSAAPLPPQVPGSTAIPSQPVVVQPKKSIVEQINDILQEKVAGTPVAQKGVRIVEDARQGVIVWVGLERFNGVDAVTDPEVRAVLKAAAAEWERRAERA